MARDPLHGWTLAGLESLAAAVTARHALAASGDYATAATAMGLSTATFGTAVYKARRRFYELWHEGEVPAKQWRRDRRTEPAADSATEARRLRNRRASARYRQRRK